MLILPNFIRRSSGLGLYTTQLQFAYILGRFGVCDGNCCSAGDPNCSSCQTGTPPDDIDVTFPSMDPGAFWGSCDVTGATVRCSPYAGNNCYFRYVSGGTYVYATITYSSFTGLYYLRVTHEWWEFGVKDSEEVWENSYASLIDCNFIDESVAYDSEWWRAGLADARCDPNSQAVLVNSVYDP